MRKIEAELGVSVGTGFLVCDDGVEIRIDHQIQIPDHEAVTGHDFLETVSYADNGRNADAFSKDTDLTVNVFLLSDNSYHVAEINQRGVRQRQPLGNQNAAGRNVLERIPLPAVLDHERTAFRKATDTRSTHCHIPNTYLAGRQSPVAPIIFKSNCPPTKKSNSSPLSGPKRRRERRQTPQADRRTFPSSQGRAH